MILGFILIIAMLSLKYKTVYGVKIQGQTIGYISNSRKFNKQIEEQIINKQEQNVDTVSLKEEPVYELSLISRKSETNENEIISKLEQDAITTYKFYTVALNKKSQI